jgi:hypothetical protein
MSALTDLSDNKISDHTGEELLLVFCFLFDFSLHSFDQFYSLSLRLIHLDSLLLKVH